MGIVVCHVEKCPFVSKSGFCRKRFLVVNQNGQCEHIYNKNGQINSNWQQPVEQFKMKWENAETGEKIFELEEKQEGAAPA